ncbi:hypothetical protein B0H34DRAFT_504997 [Crassisporium funariophilum]|nr:hypothetical protein B0H34DRAFT_504997 [Crassisporium funariophilum]
MTDNNIHGLALTTAQNGREPTRPNATPPTPPATAPNPILPRVPDAIPFPALAQPAQAAQPPVLPEEVPLPAATAHAAATPAATTAAAYEARLTALQNVIANLQGRPEAAIIEPGEDTALGTPALRDSPRKVTLPPIVPGFKANALDHGK